MSIALISGIIVDLFIVAIIISVSYIGYRRGLTAVLYKIIAFVVSILIVFVLYKPVSNTIIANTKFDDNIASAIQNVLPDIINTDGKQIEETEAEFSKASVQIINQYIKYLYTKGIINCIISFFMLVYKPIQGDKCDKCFTKSTP